jgi:hypothetical protein
MDPLQLGGHWAFEMVTLAGGSEGLQKPGCPPETLHFQRLTAYAPEVLILAPRWSSLDRSLAEVNTFPCCAFYAITFNIFIGACLYSLSLHPSSAGKTLNFFLLILEQFFSWSSWYLEDVCDGGLVKLEHLKRLAAGYAGYLHLKGL